MQVVKSRFATNHMHSHSLIFSDFDSEWYKRWAKELKQTKANLGNYKLRANKFWQNAVIVEALSERGLLQNDKKCIGFGVGQERLPSLFAKLGVNVLATDQDYRKDKAKHWQEQELATGLKSLNMLKICDPKTFEDRVSYSPADMNKIDKKLYGKFDFTWSNCALGHLGSINAGLDFIQNSAKCLKEGGWAVHTTEVNVLSNDLTLDNNPETVIFRPREIYMLSKRLRADGFELDPLELKFGNSKLDHRVSFSPKFGNDYSKILVGDHLATQVVLVIRRLPKGKRPSLHAMPLVQSFKYWHNLFRQKQFAALNPQIKHARIYEHNNLQKGILKPLNQKVRLSVSKSKQPKSIFIEYQSLADFPVFGMHNRLYSSKPIALSTADPLDRSSMFRADDWFNNQPNRISPKLFKQNDSGNWDITDYVRPGEKFAFSLKLDPTKVETGSYTERFMLVQEGFSHLEGTQVSVNIDVVN